VCGASSEIDEACPTIPDRRGGHDPGGGRAIRGRHHLHEVLAMTHVFSTAAAVALLVVLLRMVVEIALIIDSGTCTGCWQ
jgi:hypothetical protein